MQVTGQEIWDTGREMQVNADDRLGYADGKLGSLGHLFQDPDQLKQNVGQSEQNAG